MHEARRARSNMRQDRTTQALWQPPQSCRGLSRSDSSLCREARHSARLGQTATLLLKQARIIALQHVHSQTHTCAPLDGLLGLVKRHAGIRLRAVAVLQAQALVHPATARARRAVEEPVRLRAVRRSETRRVEGGDVMPLHLNTWGSRIKLRLLQLRLIPTSGAD